MRVAPKPWDKFGNVELLRRFAKRAAGEGADVVVTPQGFVEGYLWNDDHPQRFSRAQYFNIGETVDGPLLDRVRALVRDLNIYLVVGFAERRDARMYNSVIVCSPEGETVLRYSKTHTGDDEPYNTKGNQFPVLDTPFGRWGVLICMDRQLPEPSRILAIKGANLIVVPAWGMCGEMNDVMMRTRAYENGVHVAFFHPRRCLIIGPDGTIIAQDRGNDDEVVSARIAVGTRHYQERSDIVDPRSTTN
jgi:predicted amidohydrolase